MGGRDAEPSGGKVEHGDEVVGRTEPLGLSFDCREDAVEGFEEPIGRFISPVSERKLGVSVHFFSDTGCMCHLRLLKRLDSCVRSQWGETELARPATVPRAPGLCLF